MQYLRARYYDPRNGRFNRFDPFAGSIKDPLSLHKYLYAHADPISHVDPSGELIGTVISFGAGLFNRPLDITARIAPYLSIAAFQRQLPSFRVLTALPTIEFGLTIVTTGLLFLEGAMEAWLALNEDVPQGPTTRGEFLERKTNANLGATFPKIDDFRNGQCYIG